jgi:tetratricopeptide (TPR) repeat protein
MLLLGLLLLVATVALYYPVHSYPFINFDDNRYVTENPHIQGMLDLSMVKWALLHPYLYNWHPLTWLSHALDIQMFGLDAGRHHEVNLILHALNALLLFWVLKRATGFTGRSFMVAALFALHPINVESVVWIAERKTLLSTTFFLLALGAYRWYVLQPKLRRMAVVALLYGLGLMAKPQVITLPFVLLLWDYWPLRRMFAQPTADAEVTPAMSFSALVKEKAPLFAICAVDALITMVAQHAGSGAIGPYTLPIRLENALVSYARYVGQLFWPAHLAILYLHPLKSLQWWQAAAALLLLLAISALVVAGRRHRYLVVGWLWFLGTLVPMIGLVQVYLQAMADRYAYVSFIGLFLMVCWGVSDWAAQQYLPRAVLPAVSVAVLLAITAVSHRQIEYWQDSVTVWTHTLEVTNNNWVAEVYLGSALREQGLPDEALAHFYRAVANMTRRDPEVYLGIATIEQQRGNLTVAIEYYKKALVVVDTPSVRVQIFKHMGLAYRDVGDEISAQQCLAAAAHQAPPVVDWQGDWWHHIGPAIREYFRYGRTGPSTSSPGQ